MYKNEDLRGNQYYKRDLLVLVLPLFLLKQLLFVGRCDVFGLITELCILSSTLLQQLPFKGTFMFLLTNLCSSFETSNVPGFL